MSWTVAAYVGLIAAGLAGPFRRFLRQRTWERAAESCGLEVVWRSGPKDKPQAIGIQGGPAVRIEDLEGLAAVVFPGPEGVSDVFIRPTGYELPEKREIQTGDELFDSQFLVEGPEQILIGLLDAETRRLLLSLNLKYWVEITRGETRVETSNRNLRNVLPLALAIGRRLARRADVVERLSENACNDTDPRVRLRNLLFLIREHPGKHPTLVALRKACSDPVPEIRLRAAMALGGDRSDVLVELAESLEDDAVSEEAMSTLGRELPFERTRALLEEALRRSRIRTAHACVTALGASGDAAAVGVLAQVLESEQGELAVAAAVALGATGSPAAEPPLLDAFQREQSDLRVAAASALGRVGSAAAVLPLKEAVERHWLDLELRGVTRQAIAEIQARLQGASPGQLSLAQSEAGQLSLAGDQAGQLSMAQAEAGQLTMAHTEAGPLSLAPAEIPLLPHSADAPEQPARNARETPGVRQG